MSSSTKLKELRRKTDQELPVMVHRVHRELERGLILASVAATRTSPLYAKADKIHSKMKTLLPALDGLGERARLESKLRELGAALDRTPARTSHQMTCAAQGD